MLRMIGKVVKGCNRILMHMLVIAYIGFKLANHAHVATEYLA